VLLLPGQHARAARDYGEEESNGEPNPGAHQHLALLLARLPLLFLQPLFRFVVGCDAGFDEDALLRRQIVAMACQPLPGDQETRSGQKRAGLFLLRQPLVKQARLLRLRLPDEKFTARIEPPGQPRPFAQDLLVRHLGRPIAALLPRKREQPPLLARQRFRDAPFLGRTLLAPRAALDDVAEARDLREPQGEQALQRAFAGLVLSVEAFGAFPERGAHIEKLAHIPAQHAVPRALHGLPHVGQEIGEQRQGPGFARGCAGKVGRHVFGIEAHPEQRRGLSDRILQGFDAHRRRVDHL
jgi:hypothetical protein